MTESSEASSNSEPGARLRDRPEGRPIGAVSEANWRAIIEMADREGFEPPIPLRVCRISSAVHSTTLPPVRGRSGRSGLVTTRRLRAAQAFRRRQVAAPSSFCGLAAGFSLTPPPSATRKPRPAWGNPRPISFGASLRLRFLEPVAAAPGSNPTTQPTAKKPSRVRPVRGSRQGGAEHGEQ